MLNNLRSQIYKIKRTPIVWIMFLWPVLAVSLFVAYYSKATWTPEQELIGYFQTISLVMPCLVTLLCTYVAQQEQGAGDCFNLLCVGSSRIGTFFSLFILFLVLVAMGMIISAVGFYLFRGQMNLVSYVLSSILMLIPLASLLLIQAFIAFRFGSSWSVATGAIFLLVGALGVTVLFDHIWYYIPPVWAPRFTSLMILNFFHRDNIIVVATELKHGLLFCLIFSLVFVILVPAWFNTWDGRPSLGDE